MTLLAVNRAEVRFADAQRALIASLLAALLLYFILYLLLRNLAQAAFFTSAFILLFISYGQVYGLLKTAEIGGVLLGRHRVLIPLWLGLGLALIWLGWRRDNLVRELTPALNLFAALSLLMPLLSYANFQLGELQAASRGPAPPITANGRLSLDPNQTAPDIYYIILDGYAREDILREEFGYDNSDFISFLEDRGFVVAQQSSSNYMQTALSLASALNMNYLPSVRPYPDPARYPQSFYEPIKHSLVRRELEALGYQTVSFPSGWYATEIYDADFFLSPDFSRLERLQSRGAFNAFESMLVYGSAGLLLADLDTMLSRGSGGFMTYRLQHPFTIHQEYILAGFDHLEEIPEIPGPKFVFAHIISNHPPFSFDREGNPVRRNQPFTLADDSSIESDKNIPIYVDQLVYINALVEEAIDAILENSAVDPIIIIQADHGPVGMIDWNALDERSIRIRSSILNAYYLPQACRDDIYPSITPVNTYRVVFNCQFNGAYDLIEDKAHVGSLSEMPTFDFPSASELLE